MMDYEVFKQIAVERFLDYMPEEYRGMDAELIQVDKVNRSMDGIRLVHKGAPEGISPTVYINDMYDHYQSGADLDTVLRTASEGMERAFHKIPRSLPDMETASERVVFQLVNTLQNEEFLKEVPHRPFQDLSVIYRMVVNMDVGGKEMASAIIRNGFAEKMGLSEEQLFQAAQKNTKLLMPPVAKRMRDVMKEMMQKDGMPEEMADQMLGDMREENEIWVLSNESGIHGSAFMLYEDNLKELADLLGDDLYLLPSSIHEVLAVSASGHDPYELAQIVDEVNMSAVELSERLSNQVYFYDKDLRKLSLATDTPLKRLDDKADEKAFSHDGPAR